MNDSFFIDTNILVYSSLKDELAKHDETVSFLSSLKGSTIFVSTQVLSELYVALLKHGVDETSIVKILTQVADSFNVSSITLDTVVSAWKIKKKYQFSYWDSLIIASALAAGCSRIYTEDMQHGQLIGKKLKIINPMA
jgi:predicted nucleic acid-binding protein